MSKKYTFILFALFALMITGCASSDGTRFRTFIEEKERVDQDFTGNKGNWENAQTFEEPGERRKTRRYYVFEWTKKAEDESDELLAELEELETAINDISITQIEQNKEYSYSSPDIDLPSFDDDTPAINTDDFEELDGEFIEYTVLKADTLQKISKKFYDSYSKWPRIYEANKSVIKNPDKVQPGIVIRIPMD